MQGWETSRHPEWDLMYAAGLTVREIAEHCHAPRSTVQRHLQVREGFQPGTRGVHEEAFALRPQTATGGRWLIRLQATKEFIKSTGRQPRYQSHAQESTLYQWLTQQRSADRKGNLTPEQLQLLDSLRDWRKSPQQQALDEHWIERLQQLVIFQDDTGQLPRYGRYDTAQEHTLGVWLHIQSQRRSRGLLLPWREQALDDAVPGWRSRE